MPKNNIELPQMSEETATEILDRILYLLKNSKSRVTKTPDYEVNFKFNDEYTAVIFNALNIQKEDQVYLFNAHISAKARLRKLFLLTDPDILFDYVKKLLSDQGFSTKATSVLKTILVETFPLVKRFITPEECNNVVFLLDPNSDTEYEKAIYDTYKQSQKTISNLLVYGLLDSIRDVCREYIKEALSQRWTFLLGNTIFGDHVDIASNIIFSISSILKDKNTGTQKTNPQTLEEYVREIQARKIEKTDKSTPKKLNDAVEKVLEVNTLALLREGRLSNRINGKITEFTKQWIKLNKPKPREGLESLPKKLAEIVGKKIDLLKDQPTQLGLFKAKRHPKNEKRLTVFEMAVKGMRY